MSLDEIRNYNESPQRLLKYPLQRDFPRAQAGQLAMLSYKCFSEAPELVINESQAPSEDVAVGIMTVLFESNSKAFSEYVYLLDEKKKTLEKMWLLTLL